MPVHLLDTDILIDFLRGREAARELIAQLSPPESIPFISVVSVAELLAGMKSGEQKATEGFLSLFKKIPVTEVIARSAGFLLNTYGKTHGLELGDALIAATAMELDATLLSCDSRHYPMPFLKKQRPY